MFTAYQSSYRKRLFTLSGYLKTSSFPRKKINTMHLTFQSDTTFLSNPLSPPQPLYFPVVWSHMYSSITYITLFCPVPAVFLLAMAFSGVLELTLSRSQISTVEIYKSVDIRSLAWNWQWGEYLHHGNQQELQSKFPPNHLLPIPPLLALHCLSTSPLLLLIQSTTYQIRVWTRKLVGQGPILALTLY